MTEQGYQSKIIKAIEDIGGIAINGNFTKAGTADLICGYPKPTKAVTDNEEGYLIMTYGTAVLDENIRDNILLHLHVEVKTKHDYDRVFRSIKEIDERYVFEECTKSLKKHEYLQISKLNIVRDKGGLGLIAHSFEQVKEYVDAQN